MNFYKKVEQSCEALNTIQCSCTNEVNQFIEIIKPLLCKENDALLCIEVGKRMTNNGFTSFLSTTVKKFTVLVSENNGEVCLLFKDLTTNGMKSLTMINLNIVSNISVSVKIYTAAHLCTYNVYFSYGEIDYHMEFKMGV